MRVLHFALTATLSCVSFANAEVQTISIDFGPKQQPTSRWNNVTSPLQTGILLKRAEDDSGRVTSVQVRQTDPWAGFNTNGHRKAGPYPPSAKANSFYLERGKDEQATLHIEGLSPDETYVITIFASRMGGDKRRAGRYSIGEKHVELNAAGNTQQTVAFADAKPDANGVVVLHIECAKEQSYAYLGTLTIAGVFNEAPEFSRSQDSLDGPPIVSARAWAIADGRTGEFLWGENETVSRDMASTTKIMTAWIVLELATKDEKVLEEVVTVSAVADKTGGSSANINAGEKIVVKDLLFGLLLPSGNDAAVALGEHFGSRCVEKARTDKPSRRPNAEQSLALFVAEMNRRAKQLNMPNTRYLDPHGNSRNRSSAQDLLRLAWSIMQNTTFRKCVATRRHNCRVLRPDSSHRDVTWKNTNQLLEIQGFDGVKTGTTGGAGACLVSSGRRGKDRLLVVVLGSTSRDGRYVDSRNLYRWAWTQRGHK